jgi:hypothetical protein
MTGHRARHPREALDLTVRAVALRRAGAAPAAVLAALDQARASVSLETDPAVARSLTWICVTIAPATPDEDVDHLVVDAALRYAARNLGPRLPDDATGTT